MRGMSKDADYIRDLDKDRDFIKDQTDLTEGEIRAVEVVERYGWIDGGHHKLWCLHQMVKEILGHKRYAAWANFHGIDTEDRDAVGTPP